MGLPRRPQTNFVHNFPVKINDYANQLNEIQFSGGLRPLNTFNYNLFLNLLDYLHA